MASPTKVTKNKRKYKASQRQKKRAKVVRKKVKKARAAGKSV